MAFNDPNMGIRIPRTRMNRNFFRSPLAITGYLAIVIVIIGIALPRADWLIQGAMALSLAILATSLGIALGLGGQFLLGITFIFATGAYVTAVLVTGFSWDYWPSLVVAVVVSIIVGLIMSLPGLRVGSFYFGMLGFFLVFLIPGIVAALGEWTEGSKGIMVAVKPDLFGTVLDAHGIFILCGIGLIATLLVSIAIRSSPFGMYLRRMRDAQAILGASTGVALWRVRLFTYTVCSVLAGIGGALYANVQGFIRPSEFGFNLTVLVLAAVIVGGSGSLFGPSIGVIVLFIVPRVIVRVPGWEDIIYGAIILVSILLFRGGIVNAFRDVWRFISPRRHDESKRADEADQVTSEAVTHNPEALAELLVSLRGGSIEGDHEITATGVRKRYGGVQALDFEDEQTVTVRSGEVHLLLGPNGSGKTTLLNTFTGLVRSDTGSVVLDGVDVVRLPVWRIVQRGLGRSFQGPMLPDELTPVDLFAASLAHQESVSTFGWLFSGPKANRVRRESRATAMRIAEAAGLADPANLPCVGLTSGQRRIVDVIVALLGDSSIVLLDEPAAGLSDPERRALATTVRALTKHGLGFMVVEHDLELALGLADTVTVIASGRPVAQGSPDDIRDSELVKEILIGANQ